MPCPAILAITCCFAPHLLSHAAPRHGRGHVTAVDALFPCPIVIRDRGIVYSRQKSRGKASLFSAVRFGGVTLILSRVVRDRRRRSPSLLKPVSVDRSIVEATTNERSLSKFSNRRSFLCDKMKTFVHIALVAACLIACAHALPGARRDSTEEEFDFTFPSLFAETMNRMRQNLMNYFWSVPDFTNIPIPEGANTTSTTKIINGHVVTINETTYTSGDEFSGTAFRVRIIDVKPANDTLSIDAESATVKPEATESRETVEDFNNEIPKNTEDTLTA
ncbi:icarapin-like [Anoplolepis gracilipes]|uniref:icarapin-like n=1 Tax=Anoplolepis gracilipes TaxID=354296 RepID=UPI003BA0CDD2